MRIGVYTNQYGDIDFDAFLTRATAMGAQTVELGVGGMYATGKHCAAEVLLNDSTELNKFQELLKRHNVEISAFGVHGNPVHPNPDIAKREISDFKRACLLAEKLGVDRFNVMSGLPAAGPKDEYPNWICNPWPDELQDGVRYQWEQCLIPYWSWATCFAREHGVQYLNIEAHPGMAVYNVETLLKLHNAVGDGIACNFDPSHLIWHGDVDVYEVILALGKLIKHAHGKDVYVNRPHVRVNGILTSNDFKDYAHRPWTFRSPGYGSNPNLWKDIMFAFSVIGYDNVISVEYEDWHMDKMDALNRSLQTLKTIANENTGELFGNR